MWYYLLAKALVKDLAAGVMTDWFSWHVVSLFLCFCWWRDTSCFYSCTAHVITSICQLWSAFFKNKDGATFLYITYIKQNCGYSAYCHTQFKLIALIMNKQTKNCLWNLETRSQNIQKKNKDIQEKLTLYLTIKVNMTYVSSEIGTNHK